MQTFTTISPLNNQALDNGNNTTNSLKVRSLRSAFYLSLRFTPGLKLLESLTSVSLLLILKTFRPTSLVAVFVFSGTSSSFHISGFPSLSSSLLAGKLLPFFCTFLSVIVLREQQIWR